jgi:putative transposase
MNPVVAGMVQKPEEYRCSSYRVNAWGTQSELTSHEEYLKLGMSGTERCYAYRELFQSQIPDEDVHLIERASHYSHPVGDDRFKRQIEQKYGIKLGQAARGRTVKRTECGY